MNITIKDYSQPYQCWFVKKIDSILTDEHHYKMIVININDLPF